MKYEYPQMQKNMTDILRCLIVDDEQRNRDLLQTLLERYCQNVQILKTAGSGEEAIHLIDTLKPDLVFLDIEMPGMNGFEMLSLVKNTDFAVVFVTSHHHYAIKAIKFSAVDYLLKPIDIPELKAAVAKVIEDRQRPASTNDERYEQFLSQVKNPGNPFSKIGIPTRDGIIFIEISRIVRCESDVNYTWFILDDKSKLLASRTLKEFESILEDHLFFRIHKRHLINIKRLEKYVRGEGGSVLMDNGDEVEVSRRSKEIFLQRLKELQTPDKG